MDKTLFKNIASLFGIQGMNYLIPLITLPYLVRVLDPIGYGSLGFALAIVQYCCMLTDYGFNLSATQQIAVHRDDKQKVSKLFWSVLSCKVGMAILSVLAVSIAIYFVPKLNDLSLIIYSGLLMVLGNVLFPIWLFQGKEKMGWIAISNITARLLAIPLIFIFVNKPEHAYIAALITSLTTILAGCIGLYFVWRQKWVVWYKPTRADLVEMLKGGWHIFLSAATSSLYTTGTTLILGFMSGPVSVGYFVAADKLRQAIQGLISPLSQSFYPRVNATLAKNKNDGLVLIRKILKIQGFFSFSLSMMTFSLSSIIVSVVYGENYQSSVNVLMFLAWLPFIIGVANVLSIQTLIGFGYKREVSRVYILFGVLSVFFCMPLSYKYNEIGAAISLCSVELLITFVMTSIILRKKINLF
ncbi:flippase [Aeromonas veronii]|uniref:flippase n=1 Tax=Aeromonas sp. Y301-2 TaxID=2990505 RepID=UPI0022E69707|nr:flippase [Aeromonas sp. Y301-2]